MTDRSEVLRTQLRELRELQNRALSLGFIDDARHWVTQEKQVRNELRDLGESK